MNKLAPLVFDGEEVDDGIVEAVRYLRDAGFNTIASCQGKSPLHPYHSFNMPVVRIEVANLTELPIVANAVRTHMDEKYEGWSLKVSYYMGPDNQPTSFVILDVMFVKSVREEFDITKWHK